MKKEVKKIRLKKSTVSILNGSEKNAVGGAAPTYVYTVCQTNKNCNTLEFICQSVQVCPGKVKNTRG